VIPVGSSKGICGGTTITDGGVTPPPDAGPQPDAGPPACAFYGQSCSTLSCCDSVPCTNGICRYP
jgi:hypothetical protein